MEGGKSARARSCAPSRPKAFLPGHGMSLGGFGLAVLILRGCDISVASSTRHLCGGLPGGGTAEADARQGKSTDKKCGRHSDGYRALLGRLWALLATIRH